MPLICAAMHTMTQWRSLDVAVDGRGSSGGEHGQSPNGHAALWGNATCAVSSTHPFAKGRCNHRWKLRRWDPAVPTRLHWTWLAVRWAPQHARARHGGLRTRSGGHKGVRAGVSDASAKKRCPPAPSYVGENHDPTPPQRTHHQRGGSGPDHGRPESGTWCCCVGGFAKRPAGGARADAPISVSGCRSPYSRHALTGSAEPCGCAHRHWAPSDGGL